MATPKVLTHFTAILLALLPIASAALVVNPPRTRTRRASTTAAFAAAAPASIVAASWSTLGKLARRSPFATAFFVGGSKGALGDLVAQSSEGFAGGGTRTHDGEEVEDGASSARAAPKVDYKRMCAFLLYGGLYQVRCCVLFHHAACVISTLSQSLLLVHSLVLQLQGHGT